MGAGEDGICLRFGHCRRRQLFMCGLVCIPDRRVLDQGFAKAAVQKSVFRLQGRMSLRIRAIDSFS